MNIRKWSIGLIAGAAFLFLFKTVYNYFGHGVTSAAMDTAWLFPLGLWVLILAVASIDRPLFFVPAAQTAIKIWLAALMTTVVGRLLAGIFEIAGTGSGYVTVYYILAAGLALLGTGLMTSAAFQLKIEKKPLIMQQQEK